MHEINATNVIIRKGTIDRFDLSREPFIKKIDAIPYKMLNANNRPATVRVAVLDIN
jgi:hypothetical protein